MNIKPLSLALLAALFNLIPESPTVIDDHKIAETKIELGRMLFLN